CGTWRAKAVPGSPATGARLSPARLAGRCRGWVGWSGVRRLWCGACPCRGGGRGAGGLGRGGGRVGWGARGCVGGGAAGAGWGGGAREELAEAAGLSPRSVSDLERGIHRTAHKDTACLLAGALGLPEQVRILFVAAARGKAPAADVLTARRGQEPGAFAAAATRALPRDIASFT